MDGAPTIKTLAKMAGVSNATVSLALRNHPRIRPRERARIQRIASEAGYKPNPLVSHLFAQLRLSKTAAYQSTLGLVYTGENPSYLKEIATFRDWIAGCKARASSLGYGFDCFSLAGPEITPARLRQILHARNITGVVFIGPFENNVIPPELDCIWQNSAAVVMGVRPIRPLLAFVSNDQFSTAAQAVRELLRLGYKRPGLCLNPHLDAIVEERFSGGFLTAQHNLPATDRVPIFDFEQDAEKRFRSWIKQHRPDVILTLHAAEISAWIKSTGLSVPGDIGLVHLDRTSDLKPYAGMQQNNEHVGRAAVDMVIGQLQRNEFGVPPFQKSMLITSTWVSGPTVRMQDHSVSKNRARPRARV